MAWNVVYDPARGAVNIPRQASQATLGCVGQSPTVSVAAPSGAIQVFSYPTGFASSFPQIRTAHSGQVVGDAIQICSFATLHTAGAMWWTELLDVSVGFTTDFTFQFQTGITVPAICGFVFCVQNANSTTNPNGNFGTNAGGDANVLGYGDFQLSEQWPITNSIGLKFDISADNITNYPIGGAPASTGLYANGGPFSALIPQNDLVPYGINFYTGNIHACTVVYDGSILTMVLRDTVTGAQYRQSWPVNIPACTGSNTNYVGLSAGNAGGAGNTNPAGIAILTWDYSTGYNARLAAPTFSVTPGRYSTSQSVSLSGPPGATIYYTTNGLQPTTSSTQYTGSPISVSASQCIQAVAIQSGFTDSFVAAGNYQISPPGTPLINFPAGFSSPNGLIQLCGFSAFNGTSVRVVDSNAIGDEAGAAWYVVPVPVSTFNTTFTLKFTNSSGANGMAFVIQNPPLLSSGGNVPSWSTGGPNAIAEQANGLGYSTNPGTGDPGGQGLLDSICVKFDLFTAPGNTTGLYLNGAYPGATGQQVITGVNLQSGNPITCSFNYDGTTLSMTLTDTVTHGTYSTSWTVNIPAIVGATAAYVGFTGGTGGARANMDVTTWTYSGS